MKYIKFACVLTALALTGCAGTSGNTVNSQEDLVGKKIGVQYQTTSDVIYASSIENAEIFRYNKLSEAIDALKLKEVDAVICDHEPAAYFVNSSDNKLRMISSDFETEEYGILIKKGNAELLHRINASLEEIKNNGVLDKIKGNYFGDEEESYNYTSSENETYENGTLVMVTNPEFPPFEMVENDEIKGFDIDMMKAVCDELDMELKIESMSFNSLFDAVANGNADVAVAAITVTEERLESFDFSDFYYESEPQAIVVRS